MTHIHVEVFEEFAQYQNGRRWLMPFDEHPDFRHRWWTGEADINHRLFVGVVDGEEVARAALHPSFYVSSGFGVLNPDDGFVQIFRINVATSRECQGIGRSFVQALASIYPERRFAALTQEADGFYAQLGWARHEHKGRTGLEDRLYIS